MAAASIGVTNLVGPSNAPTAIQSESPDGNPGIEFSYDAELSSDFFFREGAPAVNLVQLCCINYNHYRYLLPGNFGITNTDLGLDNSYPYGITSDSPSVELYTGAYYSTSIDIKDFFKTFCVMTPPPNSFGQEDVPIAGLNWSWVTMDEENGIGGNWPSPSGPGIVASSGTGVYPSDQFTWAYCFGNH
jgi:hypothetical protein